MVKRNIGAGCSGGVCYCYLPSGGAGVAIAVAEVLAALDGFDGGGGDRFGCDVGGAVLQKVETVIHFFFHSKIILILLVYFFL